MGKITEYPIVNSIGDNDTLFVSKDGALSQIKKSDLDIGGGSGGSGIEKILDTTVNISQKNIQTDGWTSVCLFEFTLDEKSDVLIDIDNIVFSPIASGSTFDILFFKFVCQGRELLYDEVVGYYNIQSKCHLQCIKEFEAGTYTISVVAVPKPSYVQLVSSVANVKVFKL